MRIIRLSDNYGKPKGHLDTQLFPECKGTKKDRDVVKKYRRRKKKKSMVTAKHSWPIVGQHGDTGLLLDYKNGKISNKDFVKKLVYLVENGFIGVTDNDIIRECLFNTVKYYKQSGDVDETAVALLNILKSESSLPKTEED